MGSKKRSKEPKDPVILTKNNGSKFVSAATFSDQSTLPSVSNGKSKKKAKKSKNKNMTTKDFPRDTESTTAISSATDMKPTTRERLKRKAAQNAAVEIGRKIKKRPRTEQSPAEIEEPAVTTVAATTETAPKEKRKKKKKKKQMRLHSGSEAAVCQQQSAALSPATELNHVQTTVTTSTPSRDHGSMPSSAIFDAKRVKTEQSSGSKFVSAASITGTCRGVENNAQFPSTPRFADHVPVPLPLTFPSTSSNVSSDKEADRMDKSMEDMESFIKQANQDTTMPDIYKAMFGVLVSTSRQLYSSYRLLKSHMELQRLELASKDAELAFLREQSRLNSR